MPLRGEATRLGGPDGDEPGPGSALRGDVREPTLLRGESGTAPVERSAWPGQRDPIERDVAAGSGACELGMRELRTRDAGSGAPASGRGSGMRDRETARLAPGAGSSAPGSVRPFQDELGATVRDRVVAVRSSLRSSDGTVRRETAVSRVGALHPGEVLPLPAAGTAARSPAGPTARSADGAAASEADVLRATAREVVGA
jgi:hypothetical protein